MAMTDRRQLATLLAALRFFRDELRVSRLPPAIIRVATDQNTFELPSAAEVDELCRELEDIGEEMKEAGALSQGPQLLRRMAS
jgi:hypothetical protein